MFIGLFRGVLPTALSDTVSQTTISIGRNVSVLSFVKLLQFVMLHSMQWLAAISKVKYHL